MNYDPRLSEEVAAEYAEIATYANNPEMVDIKLLGDNKIQLYVSEEYLTYAEENYITDYIDFHYHQIQNLQYSLNIYYADYKADS